MISFMSTVTWLNLPFSFWSLHISASAKPDGVQNNSLSVALIYCSISEHVTMYHFSFSTNCSVLELNKSYHSKACFSFPLFQVLMVIFLLWKHLDLSQWTYSPKEVIWIFLLTSIMIIQLKSLAIRRFLYLKSTPGSYIKYKVMTNQ